MSLVKSFLLLVRLTAVIIAACLTIPMSAADCHAEEFHNALSLQGYTGLLNTPNASVTREGHFYALYSDQEENGFRSQLRHENSYMFSIGMFSLLEAGGRFTEAPRYNNSASKEIRDLSGNFKLQIPFIPKGQYIPQLAIGVQDVGGNSHFFRTAYGVATEEIWRLKISAGAGSGPDRMDGFFGGVELKAFDWLYLLGEYDTRETNVGIRVVTPEMFGLPVNLQLTVKSSLNTSKQGDPEIGFGFQIPLGSDHNNLQPLAQAAAAKAKEAPAATSGQPKPIPAAEQPQTVAPKALASEVAAGERRGALLRISDRLAADGFQYLRVGEGEGGLLVIEYENGRYGSNELDGMGVVAGIAAEMAPPGLDNLRLVLRKKGIAIYQVSAPLADVKAFMADAAGLERLRDTLRATPDLAGDSGVQFVSEAVNPGWLRPSLVLYPELKTFIGTEYSQAEYLLSIRPDLYVPVWKGGVVNARWDIPVSWSDGFDDGQPFRAARQPSQMDRLMLFQTVRLAPTLMANLGVGMIVHDNNGTLNELLWQPGDGTHRIRFRQAYAVENDSHAVNQSYLGSYRYRYAPLDTSLEATAGRFWSRDTGFAIELKRFFGDTAISFYYKNVSTSNDERVQAGGVQLSMPLTFRQEMRPAPLQVKGSDEWNYAQETVISAAGEANQVGQSIAINPQPAYNLASIFYNRDRLSESYLKLHLLRLRDAYLRYGVKQ